jgi:hypothetical protein
MNAVSDLDYAFLSFNQQTCGLTAFPARTAEQRDGPKLPDT